MIVSNIAALSGGTNWQLYTVWTRDTFTVRRIDRDVPGFGRAKTSPDRLDRVDKWR